DRVALIEAARAPLSGAERVAALDIGWVGAATDADVIDLAGVTDPEIAALSGGHTSKAISGAFLTGRAPDRLVFQLSSGEESSAASTRYARSTEQRLAGDSLVVRAYRETWKSPADLPIRYVILTSEGRASAP